ncbi:MAG: hypothetical protein IT204_19620 [Fimbriimonadaceae bacterium]|nr:hypothetical protein [Fimbriimonadaceae bacterium]
MQNSAKSERIRFGFVDDDQQAVTAARRIVRGHNDIDWIGLSVFAGSSAADVQAALDAVREAHLDVLAVDLSMPWPDTLSEPWKAGIEFMRMVQGLGLPLILIGLTAHGDRDDIKLAAAGVGCLYLVDKGATAQQELPLWIRLANEHRRRQCAERLASQMQSDRAIAERAARVRQFVLDAAADCCHEMGTYATAAKAVLDTLPASALSATERECLAQALEQHEEARERLRWLLHPAGRAAVRSWQDLYSRTIEPCVARCINYHAGAGIQLAAVVPAAAAVVVEDEQLRWQVWCAVYEVGNYCQTHRIHTGSIVIESDVVGSELALTIFLHDGSGQLPAFGPPTDLKLLGVSVPGWTISQNQTTATMRLPLAP